jgi:hypothetical protein
MGTNHPEKLCFVFRLVEVGLWHWVYKKLMAIVPKFQGMPSETCPVQTI